MYGANVLRAAVWGALPLLAVATVEANAADLDDVIVDQDTPGGFMPVEDGDPGVMREPILVESSLKFERADHVIAGIALRNRAAGTIQLRGVPLGSDVLQALLYWNYSDRVSPGPRMAPILFDGNRVNGFRTADNPDPCWGMAQNHTFRADVTNLVRRFQHPNQDYLVTLPFDASTSTTGQNPWHPIEAQNVRFEGASLVVIYFKQGETQGPLYVYDRLANSMFYWYAAFDLAHDPLDNPALFSMAGGDGQRGNVTYPGRFGGHNNIASNELTFFNGSQIAGPPVAASDWDGSDGWPLVQLWDTHTHIVRVQKDRSLVEYRSPGDCLVPAVFVLDAD